MLTPLCYARYVCFDLVTIYQGLTLGTVTSLRLRAVCDARLGLLAYMPSLGGLLLDGILPCIPY